MKETPVLTELRLTAFKSFVRAKLPIDPMTVLTGRNSSGKSNALDGLEVLSRLAGGEELADALDGRRREGGPVRGGSRGCAPHGTKSFTLGCTVRVGAAVYRLDVNIQVAPELRVLRETLRGPAPALESGHVEDRHLLHTRPAGSQMGLLAEIHNGRRGTNPVTPFRDSRLLTSQLPLRLVPQNEADAAVVDGAIAVAAALRGVFHLDPVPHLMRDYVPERDAELRRTGENVSAAIARLSRAHPDAFDRLRDLVAEVADSDVRQIETTPSPLGDVMLALRERAGRRVELTPAREMSDGLLRFIAVATALLTLNRGLDIDQGVVGGRAHSDSVLLVIEELENGLHPSQAGRMLQLVEEAASTVGTRVVVSTHSPALLNALGGDAVRGVLVCYRDEGTGRSVIRRMQDLPGYAQAMARGALGDVVTKGWLTRPDEGSPDLAQFSRLLGIE